MQHIKAIAIKMIASLALIFVILGLVFNYSFVNILTLTLILGIVSYILGDLLLLPRTNNLTATISDIAIAMLLTWFYLTNITYNNNNVFMAAVLISIGVALFEWFFHKYMITNVLRNKEPHQKGNNLRYQTEASEELSPDKNNFKKDKKDNT